MIDLYLTSSLCTTLCSCMSMLQLYQGSSICRPHLASYMAGEMLLQLVTRHPKTLIRSKLPKLCGLMRDSEPYTKIQVSCQRNSWSLFLFCVERSRSTRKKRTTVGLLGTDKRETDKATSNLSAFMNKLSPVQTHKPL